MNNPMTVAIERRGRPLCRAYSLVLFESVSVALQADDGVCSVLWSHWALGVLPDGDHEVLGAWTSSQADGPAWNQVLAELADRGVERIGLVVVGGLAAAEQAMRDAYPGAIMWPSEVENGALTLRASAQKSLTSLAMSAGHYRKLVTAREAAQTLQHLVCRAIGRHGTFSGPTDATAFVLDRLHRAEQKTEISFVPYCVADEALTGPTSRRRKGVRIEALSL